MVEKASFSTTTMKNNKNDHEHIKINTKEAQLFEDGKSVKLGHKTKKSDHSML